MDKLRKSGFLTARKVKMRQPVAQHMSRNLKGKKD